MSLEAAEDRTVGQKSENPENAELESMKGPRTPGLKKLLEYELTIFSDLQEDDGLVITAKYGICSRSQRCFLASIKY